MAGTKPRYLFLLTAVFILYASFPVNAEDDDDHDDEDHEGNPKMYCRAPEVVAKINTGCCAHLHYPEEDPLTYYDVCVLFFKTSNGVLTATGYFIPLGEIFTTPSIHVGQYCANPQSPMVEEVCLNIKKYDSHELCFDMSAVDVKMPTPMNVTTTETCLNPTQLTVIPHPDDD